MELTESTLNDMEQYCVARFQKKCFIKNRSTISNKAFLRLKEIKNKTNLTSISDCFERLPQGEKTATYYVDINCCDCGKVFTEVFSKTSLLDVISEKYSYRCPECEEIERKRSDEYWKKRQLDIQKNKEERTSVFIKYYLTAGYTWNESVPKNKYYSKLCEAAENTDVDTISNFINSLNYKDFLNTPYWAAISQKKRQQAGYKCELCNSTGILNVHHKTYQNHGNEINNLKDLIVLCSDCHQKFHDIE